MGAQRLWAIRLHCSQSTALRLTLWLQTRQITAITNTYHKTRAPHRERRQLTFAKGGLDKGMVPWRDRLNVTREALSRRSRNRVWCRSVGLGHLDFGEVANSLRLLKIGANTTQEWNAILWSKILLGYQRVECMHSILNTNLVSTPILFEPLVFAEHLCARALGRILVEALS